MRRQPKKKRIIRNFYSFLVLICFSYFSMFYILILFLVFMLVFVSVFQAIEAKVIMREFHQDPPQPEPNDHT